jgi:hypothetical protein
MPEHLFLFAIRNKPVWVTYQWLFSNTRSPDPISKRIADKCSRDLRKSFCFPILTMLLASRKFRECKLIFLFMSPDLLNV